MTGGSRTTAALLACLAVASPTLASGCSVLFVRGPKKVDPVRRERAGCTTSRALPWIDAGLAGLEAGNTIIALSRTDYDYLGTETRGAVIGVGVGLTMLLATSAIYGFSTVDSCRAVAAEEAAGPYQHVERKRSRAERRADEAAEEAAVEEQQKAKAAADAKAAGEAARKSAP